MAAAELDLTMEQGATFTRTLTISSDGVPLDLTGRTYRGKIAKFIGGTTLASFTFTLLDQVTNTGQVTMTLSAAETAALPTKKGTTSTRTTTSLIYDVEQVLADTTVQRILQGTITLSHEVTT
jgi:hypothetical protein